MAQVGKAVLGPDVYLFHEQWVVKAAVIGAAFAWHQDLRLREAPLPRDTSHRPYLSCWCTLDDVDESNEMVNVLPHSPGAPR